MGKNYAVISYLKKVIYSQSSLRVRREAHRHFVIVSVEHFKVHLYICNHISNMRKNATRSMPSILSIERWDRKCHGFFRATDTSNKHNRKQSLSNILFLSTYARKASLSSMPHDCHWRLSSSFWSHIIFGLISADPGVFWSCVKALARFDKDPTFLRQITHWDRKNMSCLQ